MSSNLCNILLILLFHFLCLPGFYCSRKTSPCAKATPCCLRPTMRFVKDEADAVQLTDGESKSSCKNQFGVEKSSGGWSQGLPIIMTIDLEREEPISGISWNGAAGSGGVTWPMGLQVYVSSDQQNWYFVGDLADLGSRKTRPEPVGHSIFKYATDGLRTKGRWVQILVNQTPYAFCDEIEVFRGEDAWLQEPHGKTAVADPQQDFWQNNLNNGLRMRLFADLMQVEERILSLPKNYAPRNAALPKIALLKEEIAQDFSVDLDSFQAVFPLNRLHERVFALNAVFLQANRYSKPFFWHNNRWDPLTMLSMPEGSALSAPLQVDMMRNEQRSEVINLCNPGNDSLEYEFSCSGLPEEAGLQFNEVLATDTKQGESISAALKLSDNPKQLKLRVPAGTSRQVWISFRKPSLPNGKYSGKVSARAPGQEELEAEINLRIYAEFPQQASLHVGGWDYVNGNGRYVHGMSNLQDNLALMRDIYTDSAWATSSVMPQGAKFAEDGSLMNAEELDFSNWEQWQRRWSQARKYCIFMSVGSKFYGESMNSQRFKRMLADYMNAWGNYLRNKNLHPSQVVLLLVDEPNKHSQDEIIIAWAKAIKAAAQGFLIFEDPVYRNPEEALPEMYEVSDILCPNTPMMLSQGEKFKRFYMRQAEAGKELWLYSCSGPAKTLDPVNYHRAQMWQAFDIGAKGCFYWAFGCAGGNGNSFSPYLQPGIEYSPYFMSKHTVMPGKHSEAIREGVQDYEYLLILQKKCEQLRKDNRYGPQLLNAELLLETVAARALAEVKPGNLGWQTAKNRGLLDDMRVLLLNALEELK